MKKIISLLLSLSIVLTLFVGCGDTTSKLKKTVTTYDIKAEFDELKMSLSCEQEVVYKHNNEEPVSELKMNLFPNAYRENAKIQPIHAQSIQNAYPNGRSYGNIEIKNVYDKKKQKMDYSITGSDENILSIKLADPLYKGDKITFSLDYKVLLANVLHRLGYNDNTVNLGNFYPIMCVYEKEGFYECEYYANGDPFYSEIASYNVTLVYPKDFIVASSGKVLSEEEISGKKTSTYKLELARDFALVMSKNFKMENRILDKINVSYYYYNDEKPLDSINIAVESLITFNKLFGEYAYDTLAIVETGFVHGGMEYPALIYISDGVEENYHEIIVHETAHQWWYGAVGNNQMISSWLDEGLTEYATLLFYENNPKYERTRENIVAEAMESYKSFGDVYKQLTGNVNTTMNRRLNEYTSEYEYFNISYVKGMLLFENLRVCIGDKKFFEGLNNYYKDNKFTIATVDVLISGFEKASSKCTSYFDSWINGKVII